MSLTQQDMELIEARAELIAERVVTKVVSQVLATHVQTCPHGRWLAGSKRVLVGMGLGITLVSAGSSATTALILRLF